MPLCVVIIYFKERYEGKSLNDPNALALWIRRWSGERLKEKIKAEDDDITLDIPINEACILEPELDIPTHEATIPERQEEIPTHEASIPEPEPELESVAKIGAEPQEVIEGFVAACKEAEENEAQVKAYEEAEAQLQSPKQIEKDMDNEIAIDICRIVEVVVVEAREMEAQEKEAASDLNKDQPALVLMMVASVATQGDDYDPKKAFHLGLDTQPQQREWLVEMYDLDDFPEESENLVTPTVPALVVVSNRIAAEGSQHNNDLKERCVI
ncbi:hypothetical protein PIB30_000353 [Stylosanthes scabra]|uniref:Uncharacterized protein n=1 Tax=Stylosanthes scabra TaxID=79078 RepID=A0ABU6U1V8_9FABA|nr:hypothetical protein [Stylosanthes scabra]